MQIKKWNIKNKKIEIRFFSEDDIITLLIEHPQGVAYKDRYLFFNRYHRKKTFLILKKLFFSRG